MGKYHFRSRAEIQQTPDFSHGEKAQRVKIAKVHLPTEFSWDLLWKAESNDIALLELKKDVEMTPKVRIGKEL